MAAPKTSSSLIEISIKRGWNTFTKSPGQVLGAFFVGILLSAVPNILKSLLNNPEGLLGLIIGIIGMAISTAASLGMSAMALDFADGKSPNWDNYTKHINKILNYFFASAICGLAVMAGLIFLIVPGIYVAARLQFFPFLILEENAGPMEAIKGSWALSKDRAWELIGLLFVSMIINILGFIALFVGVFVSGPVTAIAMATAYRISTGKKLKA